MDQDTFDAVEEPGDDSRKRPLLRRRRAELITTARRSPAENLRHRERVYTWLQLSRMPALLVSAGSYLWLGDWIISGALFIVSVPLPWIAVVIANGRGEVRDKRTRNVYKPQASRDFYAAVDAAEKAQLETPVRKALEAGAPGDTGDTGDTGDLDVIDHVDHSEPEEDTK